ncbi:MULTISPECIES: amino acid ABC transporter permease [unclassified Pseudomonas]|uniref:amino acid ABC transporter permease n=1 Tax=unclassified Pseudomonas TaxID=196821 RepID=UPI000BD03FD4|nr:MULTISPECIES: amino acid ABC transporter permease [unclassified Pseudomonas]PVZ19732.1 amino acid ABC transporter membrane protein 1 (PAAT family) [Pseudomonas sp. URIL14HWK12:I12]PVZ22683.1 amino acid ABC transporter membrane protein 1 (PAAT family) [Pseudomonas sp. URIL14HWK12:I10]PVZ37687.1 amino acid ABC transporter membrane protein 1 (PAAT family) [Pseudomonas sp. URIL14HWK12:I11]SNZ15530.1 amino acid ABC transporter membrane protein 1, PAAT family [Pseudomonas sp. URIL14HWK12:I9]
MTDFGARAALYWPALLDGALTTLGLCIMAMVVGFVWGVLVYLMGSSRSRASRAFARVYVSFFRGTPVLAQLLLLYYLPSGLGLDVPPLWAATLALALNTAAYQSQILRSGFAAIPAGQLEAAAVFSLGKRRTLVYVQLPQVLRLTLPALVSELIDVIKVSAVVSVISITDLMRVSQQLVSQTYRPLEVYLFSALFYLVLTTLLVALAKVLERHWQERAV